MWGLIDRKKQLSIVMGLTVITLLGLQSLAELATGSQYSLFRLMSGGAFLIGTVLVIVINASWRSIWKMAPAMNKWFFPDLNETWEGVLKSTWIDPNTGSKIPPIPAKIVIIQSLLDISVRQTTGKSKSYSTRAMAEADAKADRYRLWYSYDNEPDKELHERSDKHEGVAWLEVNIGEDPNLLTGQYFTSRMTSGDMEFRRMQDLVDTG